MNLLVRSDKIEGESEFVLRKTVHFAVDVADGLFEVVLVQSVKPQSSGCGENHKIGNLRMLRRKLIF